MLTAVSQAVPDAERQRRHGRAKSHRIRLDSADKSRVLPVFPPVTPVPTVAKADHFFSPGPLLSDFILFLSLLCLPVQYSGPLAIWLLDNTSNTAILYMPSTPHSLSDPLLRFGPKHRARSINGCLTASSSPVIGFLPFSI